MQSNAGEGFHRGDFPMNGWRKIVFGWILFCAVAVGTVPVAAQTEEPVFPGLASDDLPEMVDENAEPEETLPNVDSELPPPSESRSPRIDRTADDAADSAFGADDDTSPAHH